MKLSISLFIMVLVLSVTHQSHGQSMDALSLTIPPTKYVSQAAILYNGKVLGEEYFEKDKPRIGPGRSATMTVASITKPNGACMAVNNIPFQVAIKNDRTNTMWIYTEAPVIEIEIEAVIEKCEPGDRIIFMPVDQHYALPNNEMWVALGC